MLHVKQIFSFADFSGAGVIHYFGNSTSTFMSFSSSASRKSKVTGSWNLGFCTKDDSLDCNLMQIQKKTHTNLANITKRFTENSYDSFTLDFSKLILPFLYPSSLAASMINIYENTHWEIKSKICWQTIIAKKMLLKNCHTVNGQQMSLYSLLLGLDCFFKRILSYTVRCDKLLEFFECSWGNTMPKILCSAFLIVMLCEKSACMHVCINR